MDEYMMIELQLWVNYPFKAKLFPYLLFPKHIRKQITRYQCLYISSTERPLGMHQNVKKKEKKRMKFFYTKPPTDIFLNVRIITNNIKILKLYIMV